MNWRKDSGSSAAERLIASNATPLTSFFVATSKRFPFVV